MKALEYYLRFTDWLNARFAWIVAFLIVPMLCIMIWEIVMRYFFNSPSLWAYEISLFLYGGYIVLGGAYTFMAGGHVNVDIIWGRLPLRGRALAGRPHQRLRLPLSWASCSGCRWNEPSCPGRSPRPR